MYITPFRVRLATETGIVEGYIGTVVGVKRVQTEQGITELQAVIWNKVDEETGDESTGDKPTPSYHTEHELRAHVDSEHWIEEGFEEDEDETENEGLDLTPAGTSTSEAPQANA